MVKFFFFLFFIFLGDNFFTKPTTPLVSSISLFREATPALLNVPAYFSAAFLALSSSAFFMAPSFLPRIFPPGILPIDLANQLLSAAVPPPYLKPYRVGL